jgi:hypothetical protein
LSKPKGGALHNQDNILETLQENDRDQDDFCSFFNCAWTGLPYSTTILGGRLDLGAGGIRFYGLLWIVPTVAFVLAGIGLLFSAPWWWTLTLGAVAISFLLCILRLPVAKWGALIDVLIAAVLLLGNQYGLTFLPFPAVT